MAVPRSVDGFKLLNWQGFAEVQGWECKAALLHIETL